MKLLAALLMASTVAPAPLVCSNVYQLEDGLMYAKVPVVRLDGTLEHLDAEVTENTFVFCQESQKHIGPDQYSYTLVCVINEGGRAKRVEIPFNPEWPT